MTASEMFALPRRAGEKPATTHPTRGNPHPHAQLDQRAPVLLQEQLFERAVTLPGVVVTRSCVSVPGARAFQLEEAFATGPPEAFQCEREFAHLHPPHDGSLHLTLPPPAYQEVLAQGWGEPHPISGTMMLFGPRDTDELEVTWRVLQASYAFATGRWQLRTRSEEGDSG
jgi:hypothetical protein